MEDEKKTPSKRGRKPKAKKEDKLPKKRGRKPKNNIIVNENPQFEGNYDEDITVKLVIDNPKPKEDTGLDGYQCQEEFQQVSIQTTTRSSQICWNCSYPLDQKLGMPIKKIEGIFYTYGDFCSQGCCLRYANDHYCDSTYYEILSNIHLQRKQSESPLKLPPSKYLLDIYGGPLTREEYLNDQTKYTEELSNCIHLNHVFQKNDKKISNTNTLTGDLKLYRKNAVFKQDINKLLNLD